MVYRIFSLVSAHHQISYLGSCNICADLHSFNFRVCLKMTKLIKDVEAWREELRSCYRREGPGGASVAAIVMSSNQNNKVWQVAQLYKLHSKILVDQRCVSCPKLST